MGSDVSLQYSCSRLLTFQSTLPHGERRRSPSVSGVPRYFNPRSRMGSDLAATYSSKNLDTFQSTLPHGERPASPDSTSSTNEFQSTLPHGERQSTARITSTSESFQSTLPHGERPTTPMTVRFTTDFNPRSRMGSDCNNGQHIPLCGRYHPLLRTMCCCGSVLSAV